MLMYGFPKRTTLTTLALLIAMIGGCSDDQPSNEDVVCSTGERVNPITNLCEPVRSENLPPEADVGQPSDSDVFVDTDATDIADATENNDVSTPDTNSDADVSEQDSDPGDISNPQVNCYDIASGSIAPNVVCNFYAHTDNTLYLVDPFRKTLQEVMPLPANTFDIDMHTNGILYAVAGSTLYSLTPGATTWSSEGLIEVGNPNGLCLDMGGRAFITSYSDLYSFDLDNRQLSSPIGGASKLKPYSSSGDCVINKGDKLYMSSSANNKHDELVQIDGHTGDAVKIGSIGFTGVYALTAAWERLYGLTGAGELIEIDSQTGKGTLIHEFPGKMWFGAASTPQR